jgi:putative sterol carrier protein
LAKFQSDEWLAQYLEAIVRDEKWGESARNLKTSLKVTNTDTGEAYVIDVENGVTTGRKAPMEAAAEYSFMSTTEGWSKLARGETDMQSAILKGLVRYKGSLTKLLMNRKRLDRLTEIMQEVPTEF